MKYTNKNIEAGTDEFNKEKMNSLKLKIRRKIMKTRILISGLAALAFLFTLNGCGMLKKAETKSSFAGRQIFSADSNSYDSQPEEILYDMTDNQSQGRNVSYFDGTDSENNYETQVNSVDVSYNTEEILNENPISVNEDATLEQFENKLSDDGDFVQVNEEEIDPDNNISTETVKCETDVYTTVIWVPKVKYVYAGWNPYTNGRWVWTRYGWTWKSYYHWGWATHHYGRWWYSHRYGWVWSPGRRWAPAWVIWGHHGNYTGWHPISPRIRIHTKGISPIMPRLNNNGWVIVKTGDLTKNITTKTLITGTERNDIIKNTTKTITLKQDGNSFINKGPELKKDESLNKTVKKNVTGLTASEKKENNNLNREKIKTAENKSENLNKKTVTSFTNDPKKLNGTESEKNKTVKSETKTVTTNTQKQNNETKNSTKENHTKTVKENNYVTKSPVKENQIKTETKQTNTFGTNKSGNENKTVNKTEKKTSTEQKPKQEEKSRNTNTTTKSNDNVKSNKIENIIKNTEKPVKNNKSENTVKTEKTIQKVEQPPKQKTENVNSSKQKSNSKDGK